MRVLLTTAVLVGAGLFSYALSPGRVAAQGSQFPQAGITSGEKLRVWLDVDRTAYDCTVIEVRGDFLGCRGSDGPFAQGRPDRWYNLRFIVRLDRPARQE